MTEREQFLGQIERLVGSHALHGSESLCKLLRYSGETRRRTSRINSERVSNRDGGFREALKLRSAIGFDGPGASRTLTSEVGGVLRVQRDGRHDRGGIAQGRVRAIVPPWADDGREDPWPEREIERDEGFERPVPAGG